MTGSLGAHPVRDALNRLPMCAHSRQELGCFLCDAHNELDRLVASVEALTSDLEKQEGVTLARVRELRAAEARVVALTSDNAKLEHKARYTMKMLHAADHAHHERTRLIDAAEARVVALTRDLAIEEQARGYWEGAMQRAEAQIATLTAERATDDTLLGEMSKRAVLAENALRDALRDAVSDLRALREVVDGTLLSIDVERNARSYEAVLATSTSEQPERFCSQCQEIHALDEVCPRGYATVTTPTQAFEAAIRAASPGFDWVSIPYKEWCGLLAAIPHDPNLQPTSLPTKDDA